MRRCRTRSLSWGCAAALVALSAACSGGPGNDVPGSAAATAPDAPHGRQQLSGHVTREMAKAPVVGRVPAATPMRLAISLSVRNQGALKSRVRAVSDPADPSYRKYLTPKQYADQFGPTPADYEALAAWARSHDLEVERTFANRVVLAVTGTTDAVERALYVQLSERQRDDGTSFFTADREPSLDVDVPVLHVEGLSDFARPRPACLNVTKTTGAPLCLDGTGSDGGYFGAELRNAYLGATACTSLTGAGQSVGLVEYAGFAPQDLPAFAQATGQSVPTVHTPLNAWPPAAGTSQSAYSDQLEVPLDIEMVAAMAPGATINVYEDTNQSNILAAIATATPLDAQISSSWFDVYSAFTQQLLDELAVQGQSYFQASGDGGGYTANNDIRSGSGITVVGGTLLGVNNQAGPAGYYQGEAAWSASGGGYIGPSSGTTAVPIPPYQQGISLHGPGFSTQYRNLPDVAMVSDLVSVLLSTTESGPAMPAPTTGSSVAAPLWAGVMALVNQQNPARPVGFANPALYALGKANAGYFHDVTSTQLPAGMFSAAPGYDLSTGWGSPTCSLIDALSYGPYEHAPTAPIPSGFKTFGGQSANLCLAPVRDNVAAGMTLVSETCSGSPAQNWVLGVTNSAQTQTISPATNTGLCIDANPATGSVILDACTGNPSQQWTVGNNIVSRLQGPAGTYGYCLDVYWGKTTSGQRVDVTTCNETEAQDFWPWGFPLTLTNAAGSQCLNNPGDGAIMNDGTCASVYGPATRSQVVVFTENNEIIASGAMTASSGDADPACVSLDGLNGYYSNLSTTSCSGPASQTWSFSQFGVHNGSPSWGMIRSQVTASNGYPECIDVQGANPNPGTEVDVWQCNWTLAQAWQVSVLRTDEIGFSGY